MKFIKTLSLFNRMLAFHRDFWNVYQLEDRSRPVFVKSQDAAGPVRPPLSLIIYQLEAADFKQSLISTWKQQLNQPLDEMILVGRDNVENLNAAIQPAKNSLVVTASADIIPSKDWLMLMADAMSARPEAGYALGRINLRSNWRRALAGHASKMDNLNHDLVIFRKQIWARAGGCPADVDVELSQKVFTLRLQNLNCDHLIVEDAAAEYAEAEEHVWSMAFKSGRCEGSLGLFAQNIWKQLGVILIVGLLLTAAAAALFFEPLLAFIIFLLGLTAVPVLGLGQMPFETAAVPRSGLNRSLSAGWIRIIRWIGYAAGVSRRKETRLSLELEADRALRGIISQHPERDGIVLFSSTVDWGYMFQRYQQMARQFARRNYLVFYRTDNLRADAFAGFQEVEPMLFVTPAPLETFAALNTPLFYVNSPWLAPMINRLTNPIVIYDHCDDISVSAGQAADHDKLLKHARLVLSSSGKLLAEDRTVRADAVLLPNAVDYELVFQNQPALGSAAPQDLQSIINKKKPIIGYTGALAEWFDYGLLSEVCRLCPEYEFVLIGVDYDGSLGRSRLLECGNLTWLGHKPYQDLFQYVWRFDAAMIPFCINQVTLATSPVKLFEYFACRKPVVSTALPECEKYKAVFIAQSAAEFRSQIQNALAAGGSEGYIQQVVDIARQNTWQARVDRLIHELFDGGRFDARQG